MNLDPKDLLVLIVASFILLPFVIPTVIFILHRYEDKVKDVGKLKDLAVEPNATLLPHSIIYTLIFTAIHSYLLLEHPLLYLAPIIIFTVYFFIIRARRIIFLVPAYLFAAIHLVNIIFYIDFSNVPFLPMWVTFIDLLTLPIIFYHNKFYNDLYQWEDTFSINQFEIKKRIKEYDDFCQEIWLENKRIYEDETEAKVYYEYPELITSLRPYIKTLGGGIWHQPKYQRGDTLSDRMRLLIEDFDTRAILAWRDTIYYLIINFSILILTIGISFYRA